MFIATITRRVRLICTGFLLVTLFSALLPHPAGAANPGVISGTGGDGAWLKAGPSAAAARLTLLAEGTPVSILDGPVGDGQYQWYQVRASGQTGWVVRDYLQALTLAPGGYGAVTGVADYGGLKLRAGPAPWEAQLLALPEGTIVAILAGPSTGGNGNPWYTVASGGQQGYVDGTYLVPTAAPATARPVTQTVPAAPTAGLGPGTTAIVTGVAAYGGLKLRAAPSPAEALLTTLPEGTTLRILEGPTTGGNGNPWYRVAWGDSYGWVDGSYLAPTGAAAPGGAGATAFVQAVRAQLGKPYGWGATGPNTFDCSGLVYYAAHKALGLSVPRVAEDQAQIGVHVDIANLAPGDLLFYTNTYPNTYATGITHVGVYIGNRQWISAANETDGVIVSAFDDPGWRPHYLGARRIT